MGEAVWGKGRGRGGKRRAKQGLMGKRQEGENDKGRRKVIEQIKMRYMKDTGRSDNETENGGVGE